MVTPKVRSSAAPRSSSNSAAAPRSSGKLPLDPTTPVYLKRIQARTLELLQEIGSFREFLTDRSRGEEIAKSVLESQTMMHLQTLMAELRKLDELLGAPKKKR
jgi:hypothetical protein